MSAPATPRCEARGERELVLTLTVHAPAARVWAALTEPADLRAWLPGAPGWTLDVCTFEPRAGGAFRYEWASGDGQRMGLSGEVLAASAPARLVAREVWDEPWYPGGAELVHELSEADGATTLVFTVRYDLPEARDLAAQPDVVAGMTTSFARLAALVESSR
ncbi:MAG: SRPBCC domain-containing protein [Planctomycetes bacterium]|nr:SRPBCC domain-containing protein [Planctomycetota bacterium]